MPDNALRHLPSVDAVLIAMGDAGALPRAVAVEAVRAVLRDARAAAGSGAPLPSLDEVVARARASADAASAPSLRPVINATGVLLQTNLGRAPLSERARRAMEAAARAYTNLEFDLASGTRGSRHEHVRELIRRTTGAEDGIVLNNNAAALFMVLNVFAAGREVVISRGQAVEIGGGFRIPDVLRQSGARLVEVGTTNRTYVRDYAAATGAETAAYLRVHSSNFKVIGFTAEPAAAELATLAQERGVLLLDDLGSGCLLPTERYGMAHEPTVQESLAGGADLALFSGDKLLGGPQCGIVAGRADLVETLRRHPLARALRVDKLTIAALNATLWAYAIGTAETEVPIWRMASTPLPTLKRRAGAWARSCGGRGEVVASKSMVGGGSLPGEGLATWCCAIRAHMGADAFAAALRNGSPAIVARIEGGRVLLDPRAIDRDDDGAVSTALATVLGV